jgi:hypothetical protein
MLKKNLFCIIAILLSCTIRVHGQVSLAPLYQYSVGNTSNVQLRTTSAVQDDTLKLPYIEDFSGPAVPIDTITTVVFSGSTLVYQIKQLKMHGLSSGDNIRVFNATGGTAASLLLNGSKYVKVLDKYTFQLFNDVALTTPATVIASKMSYCNWLRIGAPGYSTTPDTLGFVNNNGGTYINNDMAVNPISIGVASFDGINYLGLPYSTATPPAKGYADNLTSLPFNLSSYSPVDSIYMSFFWQAQGLGDMPLTSEFLSLEFKTSANQWIQVWKQLGPSTTLDTFKVAMVAIKDPLYLHKSFQYRFRSYGVLNGRFNVWNLDYIYIDTNRTVSEPFTKDIAIKTTSRSVLKNYTSIPYKHIKSLPISDMTDETNLGFIDIRDYTYPSILSSIDFFHIERDNLGGVIKTQKVSKIPSSDLYSISFTDTIDGSLMIEPYVLKEEFNYPIVDTTGRFDLSFNNFTQIETYFDDYYAYDDNVPESTIMSINPGGIRVANAYKILKRDSLTSIDFCFLKNNGPDLTNSTFFLNVWIPGATITTESTLLNQQALIAYSPNVNGFVRYTLNTPIVLDSGATYYFGFTQNFNYPLFIGYDRNNNQLDKIFTSKNGQTWEPFSTSTQTTGALMIRPVFDNGELVTSTFDKEIEQSQFGIYPNPSFGQLHFSGEPEYMMIYDLSGLLIQKQKLDESSISTESIANGLYVIILSKGDYKEAKRLIIQK